MSFPWLTLLLALPALGAAAIALVPRGRVSLVRATAALFAALPVLLAGGIAFTFDRAAGEAQLVEHHAWIDSLGIAYHLGIDGLSLPFVALATFLFFIAVVSSFRNVLRDDPVFHASLLLLESGVLGVLLSRDLFLFFLFWTLSLLPMFLLIGWFGGKDRVTVAIQYAVYTGFGSMALLVGILFLAVNAWRAGGELSFDLARVAAVGVPPELAPWVFGALLVGFATRAGVFPFHSWLPQVQAEAPTGASIVLSGAVLPMAVYGILRVLVPSLPAAALDAAPLVAAIALAGLLYGACLGMAQHDLRKRLAYASTSQLGLILLGVFALDVRGVEGAVFLAVSHGLVVAALLVLAGILDERTSARSIYGVSGLSRALPVFAFAFGVAVFAFMGVPGSGAFAGEILLFQGIAARHPLQAALAAIGTVLVAVYMLMALRRMVGGALETPPGADLRDLTLRERVILGTMLLGAVVLGVAPHTLQAVMETTAPAVVAPAEQVRLDRIDERIATEFEEARP